MSVQRAQVYVLSRAPHVSVRIAQCCRIAEQDHFPGELVNVSCANAADLIASGYASIERSAKSRAVRNIRDGQDHVAPNTDSADRFSEWSNAHRPDNHIPPHVRDRLAKRRRRWRRWYAVAEPPPRVPRLLAPWAFECLASAQQRLASRLGRYPHAVLLMCTREQHATRRPVVLRRAHWAQGLRVADSY